MSASASERAYSESEMCDDERASGASGSERCSAHEHTDTEAEAEACASPLHVLYNKCLYTVPVAHDGAPGVMHDPRTPAIVPDEVTLASLLTNRAWRVGDVEYASPENVVVLYGRGSAGDIGTVPVWYVHFEVRGQSGTTRVARHVPATAFKRLSAAMQSSATMADSPLWHMMPGGATHPKPLKPDLNCFRLRMPVNPKRKRCAQPKAAKGSTHACSDCSASDATIAAAPVYRMSRKRVTEEWDVVMEPEPEASLAFTAPRGATGGRVSIEWSFG